MTVAVIWVVVTFAIGAVSVSLDQHEQKTLGQCFINGVIYQLLILVFFVTIAVGTGITIGLAAGAEYLLQKITGNGLPWSDVVTLCVGFIVSFLYVLSITIDMVGEEIKERRLKALIYWMHN